MKTNPSKNHLDQITDYLLRQNPNLKGPIRITQELLGAAERGELTQEPGEPPPEVQPRNEADSSPSATERDPVERPGKQDARCKPRKGPQELADPEDGTKRGRGRPAYYPPWLEAAAKLVANGYTLRRALWRLGVSIPEKQLRQVYRWKLFREYYEEARRIFIADWGSTPPRKVESFTRRILADWERLGE
jgi:hypothetical protein